MRISMDNALIAGIEYDSNVVQQACVYDTSIREPAACEGVRGLTIGAAITEICSRYGVAKPDSLCITTKASSRSELDEIALQLKEAGVPEESYVITGHMESFAYYAYSQRKELYKSGVVLMDYEDSAINIHRLSYNTINGLQYITEESRRYITEDIIKDMAECQRFTEYLEEYFKENMASAVYLTGKGFDVDRLPERLAKALIRGRKAFTGQNLYVRGACFAAYEHLYEDVFDNVVLLVEGCIKVNVELDISEHERPMRFRMIKQGTNWYMAGRSADFIIEDMNSITLRITNIQGESKDKVIDISDIPYREGKTTRIRLEVKLVSQNKCEITIKDLGFGELFKSSGRVITQELDLSEADVWVQ